MVGGAGVIATPGIITSSPVTTTAPETGDIIIGGGVSEGGSGKKKGLWLAVVVGVLVLVVAIVIVGLAGGFGGKRYSEGEVQILTAQKSFSRYANYLLYGDEKDTLEGEYNSSLLYKIDEELENSGKSEYWNKTLDLLTSAIDDINKIDTNREQIESIVEYLQNQYENINFLAFYRAIQTPPDEEVISAYATSGAEGVKSLQDQVLLSIEGTSSQAAQSYLTLANASYELLSQELNIINNHGCIVGYELNYSCAHDLYDSNVALINILEQYAEIESSAADLIYDLSQQIENSCWQIELELSGLLKGGQ